MKKYLFLYVSLLFGFNSFSQLITNTVIADSLQNRQYRYTYSALIKCKLFSNNRILGIQHIQYNDLTSTEVNSRFDSVIISCYNIAGQQQWKRKYALQNSGTIYEFEETSDGGYLLAGDIGTNHSIIKLDGNGLISFIKNYPNADTSKIEKMVKVNDHNYAIITDKFYTNNNNACGIFYASGFVNLTSFITMVDEMGNIKWSKPYAQVNAQTGLNQEYFYPTTLEAINGNIQIIKFNQDDQNSPASIDLFAFDTSGNKVFQKTLYQYPDNNCNTILKLISSTAGRYYYSESAFYGNDVPYFRLLSYDKSGNLLDSSISKVTDFSLYYNLFYAYYSPVDFTNLGSATFINDNLYMVAVNSIMNDAVSFSSINDGLTELNSTYIETENSYGNMYLTKTSDTTLLMICTVLPFQGYSNSYLKFYTILLKGNKLIAEAYIDRNNNHILDPADSVFTDAFLQLDDGVHTADFPLTNRLVRFVPDGTYHSSLISYTQKLKYFSVQPEEHTSAFNDNHGTDTIKFLLLPTPGIRDLQISIIPTSQPRPGAYSSYEMKVSNVGTETIQNITATFIKDPRQQFDTLLYSISSINKDTLKVYLDSLQVYDYRTTYINLRNSIPPGLNGGDSIAIQAIAEPVANDAYDKDNSISFKQLVVNSYDPNDKLELHNGKLDYAAALEGDYLYYTIRFQNTGTATAYSVTISDTLEDKLDPASFEMTGSYPSFNLVVKDKKIFNWVNTSAYLPDSASNAEYSKGYISFRVKCKPGISLSQQVKNTAAIYFDFNPPIQTNTVVTEIVDEFVTHINQQHSSTIKVYPSPTTGNLFLQITSAATEDATITAIDLSGKVIFSKIEKIGERENIIPIDVSGCSNGMLLLSVTLSNGESYNAKVIKQ